MLPTKDLVAEKRDFTCVGYLNSADVEIAFIYDVYVFRFSLAEAKPNAF